MNNIPFAPNSDIHKFAVSWLDVFQNSTEEHDTLLMQDQMVELGFPMNAGDTFCNAYGSQAFRTHKELQRIFSSITDVQILCSGILSRYRAITHWWSQDVLGPGNREWFIVALSRLLQLTSDDS